MKKLIYLMMFLVYSFVAIAKDRSLTEITSLEMRVKESILLNGERKNSEYTLKFIKPDFLRKDILSPELNKGEVYIYDSGKKIVYLPLFDQVSEENESVEENSILKAINHLLDKEKIDEKFKKDYYSKKLKEITLEDGTRIEISKYHKYNDFLLPREYTIYDGKTLVGKFYIEECQVNNKLDKEELSKYD